MKAWWLGARGDGVLGDLPREDEAKKAWISPDLVGFLLWAQVGGLCPELPKVVDEYLLLIPNLEEVLFERSTLKKCISHVYSSMPPARRLPLGARWGRTKKPLLMLTLVCCFRKTPLTEK